VLVEKMSVIAVVKDLGIPVNSLHTCVHKFRQGIWKLDGSASPSKAPNKSQESQKLPSSSQMQHNPLQQAEANKRDLEIKLRRMTMERDY
jgi:hypothetical protein